MNTLKPKFESGRIIMTPGANEALIQAGLPPKEYLTQHLSGDWGDLSDYDKNQNERALLEGERLLSAYTLHTGTRLWILTEGNRALTTILLPDEY